MYNSPLYYFRSQCGLVQRNAPRKSLEGGDGDKPYSDVFVHIGGVPVLHVQVLHCLHMYSRVLTVRFVGCRRHCDVVVVSDGALNVLTILVRHQWLDVNRENNLIWSETI